MTLSSNANVQSVCWTDHLCIVSSQLTLRAKVVYGDHQPLVCEHYVACIQSLAKLAVLYARLSRTFNVDSIITTENCSCTCTFHVHFFFFLEHFPFCRTCEACCSVHHRVLFLYMHSFMYIFWTLFFPVYFTQYCRQSLLLLSIIYDSCAHSCILTSHKSFPLSIYCTYKISPPPHTPRLHFHFVCPL